MDFAGEQYFSTGADDNANEPTGVLYKLVDPNKYVSSDFRARRNTFYCSLFWSAIHGVQGVGVDKQNISSIPLMHEAFVTCIVVELLGQKYIHLLKVYYFIVDAKHVPV